WAKANGTLPSDYATLGHAANELLSRGHVIEFEIKRQLAALGYLGLFLLPIAILNIPLIFRRKSLLILFSLSAIVTAFLSTRQYLMPFYRDILRWNCLGLMGLRDCCHLPDDSTIPKFVWSIVITFISLASGGVLVGALFVSAKRICLRISKLSRQNVV